MFSKFSLDQTDPISKLGEKVETITFDEAAEDASFERVAFELGNFDIPEQKAVIGPKVEVLHWPSLEFKPVDMRSAYWQEQMGETWDEKHKRLLAAYMEPGTTVDGPEWVALMEHLDNEPKP